MVRVWGVGGDGRVREVAIALKGWVVLVVVVRLRVVAWVGEVTLVEVLGRVVVVVKEVSVVSWVVSWVRLAGVVVVLVVW